MLDIDSNVQDDNDSFLLVGPQVYHPIGNAHNGVLKLIRNSGALSVVYMAVAELVLRRMKNAFAISYAVLFMLDCYCCRNVKELTSRLQC